MDLIKEVDMYRCEELQGSHDCGGRAEKYRGNDIVFINNEWIYKSTGQSVAKTYEEMPCGYCGKENTPEGHDACLGTLVGVMNACCGHGIESEAYVQFWDGKCVRGKDAVEIMLMLKVKIQTSKPGELIQK